jgi:hypothetical protein
MPLYIKSDRKGETRYTLTEVGELERRPPQPLRLHGKEPQ